MWTCDKIWDVDLIWIKSVAWIVCDLIWNLRFEMLWVDMMWTFDVICTCWVDTFQFQLLRYDDLLSFFNMLQISQLLLFSCRDLLFWYATYSVLDMIHRKRIEPAAKKLNWIIHLNSYDRVATTMSDATFVLTCYNTVACLGVTTFVPTTYLWF